MENQGFRRHAHTHPGSSRRTRVCLPVPRLTAAEGRLACSVVLKAHLFGYDSLPRAHLCQLFADLLHPGGLQSLFHKDLTAHKGLDADGLNPPPCADQKGCSLFLSRTRNVQHTGHGHALREFGDALKNTTVISPRLARASARRRLVVDAKRGPTSFHCGSGS
jgi:hypothetical protein